ncbi:MAG TPA: hypothetical protein VIJ82_15620 [Streptosporangiaceae bacterium]|jgi:hypothetical protein
MAESSQHPPPPGGPGGGARPGDAPGQLRALSAALAIAAGSALLGIAGGLIWAAIAPQAQFVVASRGAAYVVNPETSAFIAADGWYGAIAVAGGVIIGLAAYLLGVRRFGPLPAAGALVGATAAAFLAWWAGRNVGLAAFRHRLEISKPGALIRQPADLGAHGALAFWPLAAGVVIGGIELVLALRERRRHPPAPPASSGRHRGPGHFRGRDEQYRGLGEEHPGLGNGQAEQRQAGQNSDQLEG